jgi:hypothetical protein
MLVLPRENLPLKVNINDFLNSSEEKPSATKDAAVDQAAVAAPAPDTTAAAPAPAAQGSASKKSPVRRTRTMADTIKSAKNLIKGVRGKKTRSEGAKKKEAPKKAAKPAAPKPKAVKKVDNTKKIKRTRTMAATIKESKKLTTGMKKRR